MPAGMTIDETAKAIWTYLKDLGKNPIIGTDVGFQQPEVPKGHVNVSFHTYPIISHGRFADVDEISLDRYLRALADNNVDIAPITVHDTGSEAESDFWNVKWNLGRTTNSSNSHLNFFTHDKSDNMFHVIYKGKHISLVPAYEFPVTVPGVGGTIDMLSFMPNLSIGTNLRGDTEYTFEEFKAISDAAEGILIAPHPYTVNAGKIVKFRPAYDRERSQIRQQVFPNIDAAAVVSTNVAYMTSVNEAVERDFAEDRAPAIAIANDNAHVTGFLGAREVGRAGNIMDLKFKAYHNPGPELRAELEEKLRTGDFKPYLHYTPILSFLATVALNRTV